MPNLHCFFVSVSSSKFQDVNWKETFKIIRCFCITNKIREVSLKIAHWVYCKLTYYLWKMCIIIEILFSVFLFIIVVFVSSTIWFDLTDVIISFLCSVFKRLQASKYMHTYRYYCFRKQRVSRTFILIWQNDVVRLRRAACFVLAWLRKGLCFFQHV